MQEKEIINLHEEKILQEVDEILDYQMKIIAEGFFAITIAGWGNNPRAVRDVI